MKKILMVSHSSSGGGAETIFLKVVSILKSNNKLDIVINQKEGYLVDQIKKMKLNCLLRSNFLLNKSLIKVLIRFLFWNLYSILKLIVYVQKEKIDIIYSGTIINYIGAIVSILSKRTHIWHIHEMNNKGYEWFNPKFNFIIRYFFKRSKMIFISEGVKNSWFERLKIDSKEINYEIIYNPIKELGYKKMKLSKNYLKIGMAGSFSENKNQKLLIETFISLRKKYENIHLSIAGENIVLESEKIIDNRLAKDMYNLYEYMEIQNFFDTIDILVVPSFSESWSLVAIEAASYGLIPIITNQTSINEILIDNRNAIYINPFKKDDLYNHLEDLILNYEKKSKLILKNNIKTLEKYKLNENFQEKIESMFS